MRDTKEKFFKISKSLFEHEQVLNDLRDSRVGSSTMSTSYKLDELGQEAVKNLQR